MLTKKGLSALELGLQRDRKKVLKLLAEAEGVAHKAKAGLVRWTRRGGLDHYREVLDRIS